MAYTLDDLNKVEEIIANGVEMVKYSDKQIEYRSLDDLKKLRDLIKRELGIQGETTRIKAKFSKGLD